MKENLSRLTHWFPMIPADIPTPRTTIIPCDATHIGIGACDYGKAADGAALRTIAEKVRDAGDGYGWPCFLRTDITSYKHGWNTTCFLASRELDRIAHQIGEIVVWAECAWAPPSKAVVVREMLPTVPMFHAFPGKMPVTRERRYFVENGRVLCHHPYWPPASIEGHTSDPEWGPKLAAMNEETADELVRLREMSERVSRAIPGAWSVDWLWTARGWFLIDMAEARESFHWEGCAA